MDASRIAVALDGLSTQKIEGAVFDIYEAGMNPIWKVNDLWDRDPYCSLSPAPDSVPESLIDWIARRGDLWVDMKLCDIPKTMANRMKAIVDRGAKYVTIMAANTREALKAAVEAAGKVKVLAVTVLTSMSDEDCYKIYGRSRDSAVPMLAEGANVAGAYGVVCSVAEAKLLRSSVWCNNLKLFVPGIRPLWYQELQIKLGKQRADDQKISGTLAEAFAAGADVPVIGRPILEAEGVSPVEAMYKTLSEGGK